MAKVQRDIIHIDQDKCDGCGLCASACAEGAIRIVDGKARLISETYCDGLGACLGECPRGAITIERRQAEVFDEQAVHAHLAASGHAPAAHPAPAHPAPAPRAVPAAGGCPGTAMRMMHRQGPAAAADPMAGASALSHWPVQLRLVPPGAPFLAGADILVCADCVPFAVPDFHARYLRGRAVLVGCPKLDDLEAYRAKLQQIIAAARPASLMVLRMEVPCCAGLAHAVLEARDLAAPGLKVRVDTIGISGGIRQEVIAGPGAD